MSKNIYHDFLNIPYDPGINLMSVPINDETSAQHIIIDKKELNPDLIRWFEQLGIKFNWYEAFYTPPNGGKIIIHTDLAEISDIAKINWTWGAQGSTLIWWEVLDQRKIRRLKTNYEDEIFVCDEEYCLKVYEQEIIYPSLVNVGRFHSTYNPTLEKRWTLSLPVYDLKTGRRLQWPEARNRLKEYVIK